MALYPFECQTCVEFSEPLTFTVQMSMSEYTAEQTCPVCGGTDVKRVFTAPTINMQSGLTAAEKTAGTTPQRKDMGRYLKDQRTRRKRDHGKGTLEGDSNELWAGNTLPDGVKAPPRRRVLKKV